MLSFIMINDVSSFPEHADFRLNCPQMSSLTSGLEEVVSCAARSGWNASAKTVEMRGESELYGVEMHV